TAATGHVPAGIQVGSDRIDRRGGADAIVSCGPQVGISEMPPLRNRGPCGHNEDHREFRHDSNSCRERSIPSTVLQTECQNCPCIVWKLTGSAQTRAMPTG